MHSDGTAVPYLPFVCTSAFVDTYCLAIMRKLVGFPLVLLLILAFSPAVFADGITSVSPSTFNRYDVEQFITVHGDNLAGDTATFVTYAGAAGTASVEASVALSTDVVAYVPDFLLTEAGPILVTVEAYDSTGLRTISGGRFVVVDRQPTANPPQIFVPEAAVAEATSSRGAVVNFDVSVISDDVTPPVIQCTNNSGDVFPLGGTTVTCTATDSFGTAQGTFRVEVVDNTPATLNLPADFVTQNTQVTYTATATDLVDGTFAADCAPASGTTFNVGTTTVLCSATDAHNNISRGSFRVTVGTTPPTLTLPPNQVVEATDGAGTPVTFSATADQSATVVCDPSSGSPFPIGTTVVDCTATNSLGAQTTGSFAILVRDTTPPVLTLPADITVQSQGPDGTVVEYDATGIDHIDGALTVDCTMPSGSTFPNGMTTVGCTVTDGHGNSASGTFKVTVRTSNPPTLHLPADITVEATGPGGAVVTFSATATQNATVVCTPASGSLFALGTTTVNCTATNSANEQATGSFSVTVRDTTPPALALPGNLTVEATSAAGAAVSYSASAYDLVSGNVGAVCTPTSGSTFALGTTTVSCSAHDAAGNSTSGAFMVTVRDTTGPAITAIAASPSSLWPPNHKMADVIVSVTAVDLVDSAVTASIISVTSNQPTEGTGDGDTAVDWVITGPLTLQLRAERSHNVDRVYTITVAVTDASGNTTIGTVAVTVTQGKRRIG